MFLRSLAFSDLVGNPLLLKHISALNLKDYDFVLCLGDLASTRTLMELGKKRAMTGEVKAKEVNDYKAYYIKKFPEIIEQLTRTRNFLQELNKKIPVFGVWGNADLVPFIESTNLDQSITTIHKKTVEFGQRFYLIGYDGRHLYLDETRNPEGLDFIGIPFKVGAAFCHAFAEEQVYEDLSKIIEKVKVHGNEIILATHSPPYGILDIVYPKFIKWAVKTYGEVASRGNIGSLGLKRVDEKFKPLLHVFGHVHEARGVKKTNATTFVNVGTISKGEYVSIEVNEHDRVKVDFLRL